MAFTGDTNSYFLDEVETGADIFKARLLIMELTFIDDSVSVDQAREKGHMHIADFVSHQAKFQVRPFSFWAVRIEQGMEGG